MDVIQTGLKSSTDLDSRYARNAHADSVLS